MSWWRARYKNNQGEYEITFASQSYEKTKAVEKFCQAIIDKRINEDNAAFILEQIIKDKPLVHGRWLKTEEPLGWHEVDCVECSVCHDSWIADEDYGLDFADFWKYCPSCGARMDGE